MKRHLIMAAFIQLALGRPCFKLWEFQLDHLPCPPPPPSPAVIGALQALCGQAMQARGGDEGHLSVFRLRSTLGPFGPESSNLPEVAGTVLSPSPNCTVGTGTSDSPGCDVPSRQQGGMATPLSCWGPVATASFSCGLERITPG